MYRVLKSECNITRFQLSGITSEMPKECHNVLNVDYDTLLAFYDTIRVSAVYALLRYSPGVWLYLAANSR